MKIADRFDRMIHKLALPSDIVQKLPNIEMTGNREVYIENFKSILEYKPDTIRIRLKKCTMQIEGSRLCIQNYAKDELYITGVITEIKYLK